MNLGKPSGRAPGPVARFFFGRLFPIPFILIGGFVMWTGLRDAGRAKASATWPETPGVVVESRVESRRGDKGGTTYHAVVRYEYRVAGTLHSGARVGFGDYGSSDPDHAQQVVNRYPAGRRVAVRVAPEDASLAALEPGMSGRVWWLPIFGAVFVTAGVAMAVFLPRAMRKQAEQAEAAERSGPDGSPIFAGDAYEASPLVSETEAFDGVTLETRAPRMIAVILAVIATGQLVIVSSLMRSGVVLIFLVADTMLLGVAALVFMSRMRVTVGTDAVRWRVGLGALALRGEVARLGRMRVALAYRGTMKNNRPVTSVLVANESGKELAFGSLLDETRKRHFACRLATLLDVRRGGGADRGNPFEG